MSTPMMRLAPRSFAPIIAAKPTPPKPNTATVDPNVRYVCERVARNRPVVIPTWLDIGCVDGRAIASSDSAPKQTDFLERGIRAYFRDRKLAHNCVLKSFQSH